MSLALGVLVSSVVLVALLLAVVRFSGLSAAYVENVSRVPTATAVAADTDSPATAEVCEVCERERVCTRHRGMTVCANCEAELLD